MSLSLQLQQRDDNELRPNCLMSLPFFKQGPKSTSTTASFLELVNQRRFHDIVPLLPNASDSWLAVRRSDGTVSTCETLHALVMYKPSVTVVRALVERLQSNRRVQPLVAVDAHGRTPLHIAVAKGCDYDAIELLMSPSAITTRDNQGRYPLHWACVYSSSSVSSSSRLLGNRQKTLQKAIRIVSALVDDYPEAATVRDVNGETPLDLLKRRNADPRIIEQLQSSWKHKMQERHPSTSTPECSWEDDGSGLDIPIIEVRRIWEEDAMHDRDEEEDGEYDDDISSVGCRSFSRDKQQTSEKHHHHHHHPRSKSKFPHEVVEF